MCDLVHLRGGWICGRGARGTPVEHTGMMRMAYRGGDASHGHFDFPPGTIRLILRDALRTLVGGKIAYTSGEVAK
jgi:hypothetical protein